MNHSSTAINRTVYVFGGIDEEDQMSNDIEWLSFDPLGRPLDKDQVTWHMIPNLGG